MDLSTIEAKLAEVRGNAAASKACALVTLGAPLPLAEVIRIETAMGVALPEDFRAFVSALGNGGTSNAISLLRLGEIDFGYGVKTWLGNDEYVGDVRAPFPYSTAWNWDEARCDAIDDDDALEEEYWAPIEGAIPIAVRSDFQHDWLVVTGPERGTVWHDARADKGGWRPWLDATGAHRTFASWYEGLLDAALAGRPYKELTWAQLAELEGRRGRSEAER